MGVHVWFFKPTRTVNRLLSLFSEGPYIHCGVAHSLASLAMYTDVNVTGVIPQPQRNVRTPDSSIFLDIDSLWVGEWLHKKWAVNFPWIHHILPARESAHPTYKYENVTSAGLVSLMVIDAYNDGVFSDTKIHQSCLVRHPQKISPSKLHTLIAPTAG